MTSRLGVHTEATLKARHEEALDIFHAWADRHRVTGGAETAAVKLQMDEAWHWVETTAEDPTSSGKPHGTGCANTRRFAKDERPHSKAKRRT